MAYEMAVISFTVGMAIFTLFQYLFQPRIKDKLDKKNENNKEEFIKVVVMFIKEMKKSETNKLSLIIDKFIKQLENYSKEFSKYRTLQMSRNFCFMLFMFSFVFFIMSDSGYSNLIPNGVTTPWVTFGTGIVLFFVIFYTLIKLEYELD